MHLLYNGDEMHTRGNGMQTRGDEKYEKMHDLEKNARKFFERRQTLSL